MRQTSAPPQLAAQTSPKPTLSTKGVGPTRIVSVTAFVSGSITEIVPSPRFRDPDQPVRPDDAVARLRTHLDVRHDLVGGRVDPRDRAVLHVRDPGVGAGGRYQNRAHFPHNRRA